MSTPATGTALELREVSVWRGTLIVSFCLKTKTNANQPSENKSSDKHRQKTCAPPLESHSPEGCTSKEVNLCPNIFTFKKLQRSFIARSTSHMKFGLSRSTSQNVSEKNFTARSTSCVKIGLQEAKAPKSRPW